MKSGNDILGAASFRLVMSLNSTCKNCLYIENLMTNEKFRSKEVGKFLMQWFKDHCKQIGCTQTHSDSFVDKFDPHQTVCWGRF